MTGFARSKPAALLRLISCGAFTWTWLQEAALASAGFLTSASRLHTSPFMVTLINMTHVSLPAFFFLFFLSKTLPSSLPLSALETQSRAVRLLQRNLPPSPQQQSSNPLSSQTCSARNSSPEALQTPQLSPYSWRDFPLISADNKPCALLQLPKVGDGWRCRLIPPPPQEAALRASSVWVQLRCLS